MPSDSPAGNASAPRRGTVVWFRRDLRVHDHDRLSKAARSGEPVFPLYVFDHGDHEHAEFGRTRARDFPRVGPFRARFLLESVAQLRDSLRALGSDLIVRIGDPATIVPQLADELRARTVSFEELPGTEEAALEGQTRSSLEASGVTPESSWTHTLTSLRDLPFDVRDTPEVFTQFRKRVEKETTPLPALDPPRSLPGLPAVDVGHLPSLNQLGVDAFEPDSRAVLAFRGGESAGLERLEEYFWKLDRLKTYKDTRNGLVGANYSSKLSPWLALGCVSARRVESEVLRYESERVANRSTYWMVFELRWRDYFQFIVRKHGRRVFRPSGLQGIPVPWRHDETAFEAWRTGNTGIPLVDASMRELRLTGSQSNRGRQIVGSFLTKNLGIDWRWGAEWFESQLIDHDVASNYGNWNYTAGIGNDARGFRYFNVETQAAKYDPRGEHALRWLPELEAPFGEQVHEIATHDERADSAYPERVVDLDESVRVHRDAWERAVNRS